MKTTDKFGRVWENFPRRELCPTCRQPDSCGDCNHRALTVAQVEELGGTVRWTPEYRIYGKYNRRGRTYCWVQSFLCQARASVKELTAKTGNKWIIRRWLLPIGGGRSRSGVVK